ncbi:hypothetical protein ACWCPS_25585 [Streptomyces mauvecolor]
MARIEDEESCYARQAASTLRGITPELLDDISTKRTWANYPMHYVAVDTLFKDPFLR